MHHRALRGWRRLDLLKNVHVIMRDVGNSGMMPGAVQAKKPATGKGQAKIEIVSGTDRKGAQAAAPVEPTPLDLRCDSKMQVYLPKPRCAGLVGPPAPPAPTLVQFDRNVVVFRGKPDDRPDQLTCDTLNFSLVPGEKPQPNESPAPHPAPAGPGASRPRAWRRPADDISGGALPAAGGDTRPRPATKKTGALGGLTLQRVHATGHAVWLYLPAQGVKLVCNELIHVRQLPFKPDQTYFRGDRTRPLQIEKVDVVEEEGPDQGKVTVGHEHLDRRRDAVR